MIRPEPDKRGVRTRVRPTQPDFLCFTERVPISVKDAFLRTSSITREIATALGPTQSSRGQLDARAEQYADLANVDWQEDDGRLVALGCAYDLQTAVAVAAASRGGAYAPLENWVASLVGRNRADGPARLLASGDPAAVFSEGTGALGALSDELQRVAGGPSVEQEFLAWARAVRQGAATTIEMVAQVLEAEAAGQRVAPPADVLAELAGVTADTAGTALLGLLYTVPPVEVSNDAREHLVSLARRAGRWAVATANPPFN